MLFGFGFGLGRGSSLGGSGLAALLLRQTLVLSSVPSTLGVLTMAQSLAVEGLGTTATLVPAQLRVEVGNAVITLGTTMRATGSAPVVLLAAGTGSLTFGAGLCPGFKVTILTGGLTFDLSFNSGSTQAFSGETIPVGGGNYTIPSGTYAGMILTFPVGTYTAAGTYEGTVQTIISTEGSNFTFTQATASVQPVFRHRAVTGDGRDQLFHVTGGAGKWLGCTDAAAVALFVNDPALTVIGRVTYTSAGASSVWLSAAVSSINNSRQRYFGQDSSGSGHEIHVVINDAITTIINLDNTQPPTAATVAHTVRWHFPGSNGGAAVSVNGSNQTLANAACNIGTNTPTRVVIGTIGDSAPTAGFGGGISDFAVFSSDLGGSDAAAWETEIAA